MEDQIPLDPELGLNPTMMKCPVCGNDTGELGLPGEAYIMSCPGGHRFVKSRGDPNKCPICELPGTVARKFDGHRDHAVSNHPCDKCAEILKTSNIVTCLGCGTMFFAEAHRVLKEFEVSLWDLGAEELIKRGLVEKVVGKISRTERCEQCDPEHSKGLLIGRIRR